MLYEIGEKLNDWKLGEKTLTKMLVKGGRSREEAAKYLADTQNIRAWSYNRGLYIFAGYMAVVFIGVPYAKRVIADIKWKRNCKKILKQIQERETVEEAEETEDDAE